VSVSCGSSTRLDQLVPWLQPWADWLVRLASYYGWGPRVTSTFRTREQQQCLYDARQQGLSDLPAARPGTSAHEAGRAFDLVLELGYESAQQLWLGAVWSYYGGIWRRSDPVHFEA
jgi:LAS superfamily LD-carboxypeptidase LdcB